MANLLKSLFFAFFLILIIAVPITAYAQNGVLLLGGFEYSGATFNYRFQENKTILRRNFHGDLNFQPACNIKIHYRFAKYFGLETGLQLNEIDLVVNDHRFVKTSYAQTKNTSGKNYNAGTAWVSNGNFDIVRAYFSPHIAGYFYFNLKSTLKHPYKSDYHPYISAGMASNYLLSRSEKYSSFYYEPTGESLQLTSHFLSYYKNYFLEVGVAMYDKPNEPTMFLGLKYYFAGNIMSGDYQDVQNGTLSYTDHVTASGSYLALSIRVGGTLIKTHKEKKINRSNSFHDPIGKNSSTIKDSLKPIKPIIHSSDSIPKEMTGRVVEVHKIIKVRSPHITLKIWDHESIDGDELSLNLNGNWILQDYVLQKQQKIIKHDLIQGVNYLLLYAKNEGRYKPCTSAILIEDGFSSQLVILNSSFEISQAIQINVVK
jgi:hypothetical protein